MDCKIRYLLESYPVCSRGDIFDGNVTLFSKSGTVGTVGDSYMKFETLLVKIRLFRI